MKSNLLFPPAFRTIGLILALPGLALGYLFEYTDYLERFLRYGMDHIAKGSDTFADELATTLIVTGLIFIGFSKIKREDKQTVKIRLDALYWTVLVNCLLVPTCFIIPMIGDFFKFPIVKRSEDIFYNFIVYNFFIALLIFIFRFYYMLYKSRRKKALKPLYLLPYKPYSSIGKIASIPFILLLIAEIVSFVFSINIYRGGDIPAVIFIGFPVFLFLWIGSKEKNELRTIAKTRLKAMQIAFYINYSLFIVATWAIYGFDYLAVIMICLISVQLIFLMVFYFQLYQQRKKHTGALLAGR